MWFCLREDGAIFLYSSHILVEQKWEIFIGVKRKESNE